MTFFKCLLFFFTFITTDLIAMEEQQIINTIDITGRVRGAEVVTCEKTPSGYLRPQYTFPVPYEQKSNPIPLTETTSHIAIYIPEMAPQTLVIPLNSSLFPNDGICIDTEYINKTKKRLSGKVSFGYILNQKICFLTNLPKAGTYKKVGKKNDIDCTLNRYFTIYNANLPGITVQSIHCLAPLVAGQKKEKIASILYTIPENNLLTLEVVGKEVNNRIIDRFFIIRITGALQPVKLRFPFPLIDVKDMFTIQQFDGADTIAITNQSETRIASLVTKASSVLLDAHTQ